MQKLISNPESQGGQQGICTHNQTLNYSAQAYKSRSLSAMPMRGSRGDPLGILAALMAETLGKSVVTAISNDSSDDMLARGRKRRELNKSESMSPHVQAERRVAVVYRYPSLRQDIHRPTKENQYREVDARKKALK